MQKIKASDRAVFLVFALGLYVVAQLIFSPLLYLGDEAYFYNLAMHPLSMSSQAIWYYGPIITLVACPIAWLASSPFVLHFLSFILAPLLSLSAMLGTTHLVPNGLNTTTEMANALVDHSLLTTQLVALRVVPIILSTISLYLIYRLAYREVGNYALLFFVPVVFMARIWAGMMWFYWDTFMMFFLILSLYFVQRRVSYLTTALLTISKLHIGFLFSLPLIIRRPRLAYCLLALVPAYLLTSLLAHNFLFPFQYLSSLYTSITSPLPGDSSIYHVVEFWLSTYSRDLTLYLIATLPCLFLFRRYPAYILFYILTLGYAIVAGLGMSHTSSIIYSGALVFPLVAKATMDRIKRVRVDRIKLSEAYV